MRLLVSAVAVWLAGLGAASVLPQGKFTDISPPADLSDRRPTFDTGGGVTTYRYNSFHREGDQGLLGGGGGPDHSLEGVPQFVAGAFEIAMDAARQAVAQTGSQAAAHAADVVAFAGGHGKTHRAQEASSASRVDAGSGSQSFHIDYETALAAARQAMAQAEAGLEAALQGAPHAAQTGSVDFQTALAAAKQAVAKVKTLSAASPDAARGSSPDVAHGSAPDADQSPDVPALPATPFDVALAAAQQALALAHGGSLPQSAVEAGAALGGLAIFASESSASSTTSYQLRNTRVTISRPTDAAPPRRPRIVVLDAAAQGLVCLPRGTVGAGAGGRLVEGEEKLAAVGQGQGIVVTVDSGAEGAAAAAGPGASATAGHGASATAGHGASATAGHGASATAGHGASATAGHGPSATAGHGASATAGHGASATAGHGASATAGHGESATAGHGASATAGHGASATAGHGTSATAGHGASATAGHGATSGHGVSATVGHGASHTAGHEVSATAGHEESAVGGHSSSTSEDVSGSAGLGSVGVKSERVTAGSGGDGILPVFTEREVLGGDAHVSGHGSDDEHVTAVSGHGISVTTGHEASTSIGHGATATAGQGAYASTSHGVSASAGHGGASASAGHGASASAGSGRRATTRCFPVQPDSDSDSESESSSSEESEMRCVTTYTDERGHLTHSYDSHGDRSGISDSSEHGGEVQDSVEDSHESEFHALTTSEDQSSEEHLSSSGHRVSISEGHHVTTSAGHGVSVSTGHGASASAGHGAHASVGHGVSATAGHGAHASAGHGVSASAGHGAHASAGHGAHASAGHGVSATAGHGVSASAGHGAHASAGHGVSASAGHGVSASAGHGASASAGHGVSATAGHDVSVTTGHDFRQDSSSSSHFTDTHRSRGSAGGATAIAGGSEGARATSSGSGSASASYVGADGRVVVDASGPGAEAAALGADGVAVHLTGDGTYTTTDESDCECVPSYLCGDEGYILTSGEGVIDIRSFADRPRAAARASRCGVDEVCCRHREGSERLAVGWLPERCGTRSPVRLDRRVVTGEASRLGQYPWTVALLKVIPASGYDPERHEYLCGGSLIAENVVLTGAHCIAAHDPASLIARVGEWDTSSADPAYPHVERRIARVIQHAEFDAQTLLNDVALLRLESAVELAPHINTLCLPPEDDYHIDYTDCVATGWGQKSFDKAVYSNILKEVRLMKVDRGQCERRMRETRLGPWFRLHESFLCAGGHPGVDTCKGDGGSPLVCRDTSHQEETYVQIGMVAWGINCHRGGFPGVYVDIIKMLPWIKEKLPLIAEQHTAGGGY